MDLQTDLPDLTEDLEANIDDLTTVLEPLLSTPLHTITATLPLLDKAKAQVLTAYAIESLLFSALQASGIPAKEHAIFAELARLKTYFAKIKTVEAASEQPKTRVNVPAVARFIKHGLAGNDKFDEQRKAQQLKERARAAVKLAQLEKRQKTFDQQEEGRKQAELASQADAVKKRTAEEIEADGDDGNAESGQEEGGEAEDENDHVDTENEDFYGIATGDAALARRMSAAAPTSKLTKKSKKEKRDEKKRRKLASGAGAAASTDESALRSKTSSQERRAKKLKKRSERRQLVGGHT